METLTIHHAKTHLSKHLRRVEEGETLIIARGNKPIAKLVPIDADVKTADAPKKRELGWMAGEAVIPDDLLAFDREVDAEITRWMTERPILPE